MSPSPVDAPRSTVGRQSPDHLQGAGSARPPARVLHRADECATAFSTHSHRIPPRSRADPSTAHRAGSSAVGLGHRSVTLRASPGPIASRRGDRNRSVDAALVRCLGSRRRLVHNGHLHVGSRSRQHAKSTLITSQSHLRSGPMACLLRSPAFVHHAFRVGAPRPAAPRGPAQDGWFPPAAWTGFRPPRRVVRRRRVGASSPASPAPGLHSHSTAAAISSGRPSRPMGITSTARVWSSAPVATISLTIGGVDGAGADGVDPDTVGPSAALLVRPMTACFEALDGAYQILAVPNSTSAW